jgi:hypothetical protein
VVQFEEAQSKLAQDDCFDGFVTRVSMDRAAAPSCRLENAGLGLTPRDAMTVLDG